MLESEHKNCTHLDLNVDVSNAQTFTFDVQLIVVSPKDGNKLYNRLTSHYICCIISMHTYL